jgi:hypothetical protein
MEVKVEWKEGTYPSFNVMIASKEGKDPFLTIRGCAIRKNKNGEEFVSFPSKKQENGEYWNHIMSSREFNTTVLKKAQDALPRDSSQPTRKKVEQDEDAPF